MAVEPLNWISWREARDCMPEVWDGWRYQSRHADQAMVNSLRRRKIPYRGAAYELGSYRTKPIALRDVVAGLLSLGDPLFASSFAQKAEYEATEWGSVLTLGGYQSQPITVKKTAELVGVELAWEQFRDDLIRFELPAGVQPDRGARSQKRGAYKGELKAFILRHKPDALARLSDDDVARRFKDHVAAQIAAGKSVLKLPQLRHIANQVAKLRPKDPATL